MNRNVGATDRQLRTALGAVLGVASLAILSGALSVTALLSPVLGVASLIMIGTSVTGTCPIYSLTGVDTCSMQSETTETPSSTNR